MSKREAWEVVRDIEKLLRDKIDLCEDARETETDEAVRLSLYVKIKAFEEVLAAL